MLSKSSKIGFLFEDSDVVKPLMSQRDLRSKNRALTLECKKTGEAAVDNSTVNLLSTQTTQVSTLLNTKKRLEIGNERPSIFRQPPPSTVQIIAESPVCLTSEEHKARSRTSPHHSANQNASSSSNAKKRKIEGNRLPLIIFFTDIVVQDSQSSQSSKKRKLNVEEVK